MWWIKRFGYTLIIFCSIGIVWQVIAWRQFLHTPLIPANGQSKVIELKAGTGLLSLRKNLHQHGLLAQPWYFEWLVKYTGAAQQLKAGEYLIPPGTTPSMLLEILTSGKVIQHHLTLIEGWSSRQILAALTNDPAIMHTIDGLNLVEIKERLGITEPSIEGLFYPDTYQFTKGTTDISFLLRARIVMQQHLMAEWKVRQADLPYQTPYQALIAASLIEKEARLAEERSLISGVIVKRLQNNMLLQIDASVIYGLGNNYTGRLRRSDMQIDTPYNTYLHKGLPPTPVAIPSLASIHAALHPQVTNNIFYVARGDGGHYFSADLSSHNHAIHQYLSKKQLKFNIVPVGKYSANLFNTNSLSTRLCIENINL